MRPLTLLAACLGLSLTLPALADPSVLARFSTDRSVIWAGEAFQLTLEFRITGETLDKSISIGALPPTTELTLRGFDELASENAEEAGKPVELRRFRTWARAPKAGTMTLAPRLDGTLVQMSRSLFFTQRVTQPIHIPCDPFPLTIKPLPATNRPPAFSGLVGNFTYRVTATPLDIAPGDLITLTTTLEGDWLPEHCELPSLARAPHLKTYDAKVSPEESSPTRQVMRQTVIPEGIQLKVIPGLTLITFDTRKGAYVAHTTGPFPLRYHAEQNQGEPVYTTSTSNVPAATPAKQAITSEPALSWWARQARLLDGRDELVLQGKGEIPARFAPAESATILFTLKPGETVTIDSRNGDWLRISCPKGTGWILAGK